MIGFGQVYIPDANFKAYLVGNTAINTNGDSEIQQSEATVFNGQIDLTAAGIGVSDLTGIEAFTALTYLMCQNTGVSIIDLSNNTALTFLQCGDNNFTSLDVSQNIALTYLQCQANDLTSIDVSNNTALTELHCDINFLTSIDVTQNTSLTVLDCHYNQLTSLDVSANTALRELDMRFNQIECLDISNNPNLEDLDCKNNLLEQLNTKNGNSNNMYVDALNNNLTCVEVDNIGVATNDWDFDSFTTITTNCNYTNPCNTSTSIQEHSLNKELLKVTDLLGRETKQTNQPLLYIYDDGTVEKRMVID